jgi:DNA mismatch repair protein MutL
MTITEGKVERSINLLPEEVYNRIAAGEVVERPASVLKELIENSLDAGAGSVDVVVARGGLDVSVTDDGVGMTKADLLLAFERHATSKVSDVGDLLAIRTLGFRGEALSAIASVSRIDAVTRLSGAVSAYRLKLHGGKIRNVLEDGAPEGTTISVRDLFFNTPARKKFLKSRGVENSHLINTFKRFALAYPQVRWSFNLDGKDVYRLPPENLANRLIAVFSDEMAGHIYPVESKAANLTIGGFVGSAGIARRSRGDQYLFVNHRWVQNRLMGHAIASGFGHLIEERKFPFYVIFLDLPPENVDVNVHPAKSEVKFKRENDVYSAIHQSVGDALQKAGVGAFRDMTLAPGERVNQQTGEISQAGPKESNAPVAFRPGRESKGFDAAAHQLVFGQKTEQSESPVADSAERTQVYQFHNRYIVTQVKAGIAIIDQHAAHERVLYEKALKALAGQAIHGQQLLFPKIFEVDPERADRLREVLGDFQALGITMREFGERSFVLEALPPGISEGENDQIVMEILDELQERGIARTPGHEQLAAAFACRAAIKFGRTLSLTEMNSLIDQLFATRFPFSCPHGRPTLLNISLTELERRFGRA